MKKLRILFMVLLSLMFVSCGEEEYINTVKGIHLNDGQSIEEIAEKAVNLGEFYEKNKDKIKLDDETIEMYMMTAPQEMWNYFQKQGVIVPEGKYQLDWIIEGKTKNGKVVVASNDIVEIRIPTEKDGDYVQVKATDINIKIKESNVTLTPEQIEKYTALYIKCKELKKKYGQNAKLSEFNYN